MYVCMWVCMYDDDDDDIKKLTKTLCSLGGQKSQITRTTAYLNKYSNKAKLTRTVTHTEILITTVHTKSQINPFLY